MDIVDRSPRVLSKTLNCSSRPPYLLSVAIKQPALLRAILLELPQFDNESKFSWPIPRGLQVYNVFFDIGMSRIRDLGLGTGNSGVIVANCSADCVRGKHTDNILLLLRVGLRLGHSENQYVPSLSRPTELAPSSSLLVYHNHSSRRNYTFYADPVTGSAAGPKGHPARQHDSAHTSWVSSRSVAPPVYYELPKVLFGTMFQTPEGAQILTTDSTASPALSRLAPDSANKKMNSAEESVKNADAFLRCLASDEHLRKAALYLLSPLTHYRGPEKRRFVADRAPEGLLRTHWAGPSGQQTRLAAEDVSPCLEESLGARRLHQQDLADEQERKGAVATSGAKAELRKIEYLPHMFMYGIPLMPGPNLDRAVTKSRLVVISG
ncbi:hypothetical protein GGR53DRAFT_533107 [Hypoxylon sp. FL1150]|nr:hypothetical protein GGR53DRAFT_533107 [Hypoxylon sp. FL1150]